MHFFDRHPRFYDAAIGGDRERLMHRYRRIIAFRHDVFRDAQVLDLACHDGRWSCAALHAGAKHVTGVDNNPIYIEAANANFEHYRVRPRKYQFMTQDVMDTLESTEAGSYDIIMLLGILYHTPYHHDIFQHLKRIRAAHLVIDSKVLRPNHAKPQVQYHLETPSMTRSVMEPTIVGVMNESCLEMFLKHTGYSFAYYANKNTGKERHYADCRITIHATLD